MTGEDFDLSTAGIPHREEMMNRLQAIIQEHVATWHAKEIEALEVGTGTGHTTRKILEADPRIIVLTIDYEPKNLAVARERLADREERIIYLEGDLRQALPRLCKEGFSLFGSAFTLHGLTQRERATAIQDIYNTLRPGGLFINADKYAHDDPVVQNRELAWQFETFQEVYGRLGRPDLAESWIKHYKEDEKLDVAMREAETAQVIRWAGFQDVQTVYRRHLEAIVVAKKPFS